MSELYRKWGYSKSEAKLFDLPSADSELPEGYYESPAEIPEEKKPVKKTAKPKVKREDGE